MNRHVPIRMLLAAALLCLAVPLRAAEITVWDFIKPGDGTPRGEALARNLAAFKAKNPDITVKFETLAPSMIDPNLIQGASTGRTPDVIRIDIHYLARHVAAGSIQPLDALAAKMDHNDWLLPWDSTVFDGKKYALPLEHRFSALLYRRDLLAKAGVEAPKTWDEVCVAGGKLSSRQVMGFAFGLSQGDSANILLELAENAIVAAGGRLFDERGKAAFDDASGRQFFQTLADLAGRCKASGPAVNEFTYNAVQEGLSAGTIAMATLGTHRYEAIRASGAGNNLGWAPPPSYTPGATPKVFVNGWVLAIGSGAKDPAAAWRYLEFITSPEAQENLAQGGEMPARKSAYAQPWFKTPQAETMLEWSDFIAKNGVVNRYPPSWFNFGQMMASAAQSVVLQGAKPDAAIATLVKQFNASE